MKLALLGDIALIGKYDMTKNSKVKERLRDIKSVLYECDYVVGNLESPLTNLEKTKICKSMHLKSATTNVALLNELGIDAVSLANNHIYDYGRRGLEETINALQSNNIDWYGIDGKKLNRTIKNESISLNGYCCYSANAAGYEMKGKGINLLSYDTLKRELRTDKQNQALSVFSIHWGLEHTNYPSIEHIKFAHELTKEGDFILHGHHPHIIQGIEKLKGSFLFYSQGNCLFDDCISIDGKLKVEQYEENKESFIAILDIKDGIIQGCTLVGFRDNPEKIELIDNYRKIKEVSEKINELGKKISFEEYNKIRMEQYRNTISKKFGKHNLKWVVSKLNYNSVRTKAASYRRGKKYSKLKNQWMNFK